MGITPKTQTRLPFKDSGAYGSAERDEPQISAVKSWCGCGFPRLRKVGRPRLADSILRARDDAADARLLADMVDGFLWGESVRGVDRGPEEKDHGQNTGDPNQRETPLGGLTRG